MLPINLLHNLLMNLGVRFVEKQKSEVELNHHIQVTTPVPD
jgi:hypothetical protein